MKPSRAASPYWYLAALGVALAGWVIGVAVAGGAWDAVRATSITSSNEPLQAKGASVAVFTDVIQADRRINCFTRHPGTDAAAPKAIPPAPIALTVEDDGATWHLVAFEPRGQDDVMVTCTPKDRRVDNAQYAYATVRGFVGRAAAGNWIIIGTLLVALVMAGSTFIARRRQA